MFYKNNIQLSIPEFNDNGKILIICKDSLFKELDESKMFVLVQNKQFVIKSKYVLKNIEYFNVVTENEYCDTFLIINFKNLVEDFLNKEYEKKFNNSINLESKEIWIKNKIKELLNKIYPESLNINDLEKLIKSGKPYNPFKTPEPIIMPYNNSKCLSCGIEYKDMGLYTCNKTSCPTRVNVTFCNSGTPTNTTDYLIKKINKND